MQTKWVGLDVHVAQTTAAVLDSETGELQTQRLRVKPLEVVDFLAKLGGMRAVYEAGPTGMGLARAAANAGLDVRVCAPSLIPRGAADRIKTDRRDAERLARLLAAGELHFVRVATEAEEQLRDLVRAREDVRMDLTRARHRMTKFLLRRDVRYPARPWTLQHLHWLSQLSFDDAASRATLADYLLAVQALLQRRRTLERALEELAPQSPFAETIARLRCFRGIDTLSAASLCSEIGAFERFEKPGPLASYLGLVPSEWTSDTKRRQGAITKAGRSHSRRILVEAAWHARHRPAVGMKLEQRQRDGDARVCEIAWRCQVRLHARWKRLRIERGKAPNVVVVALARELSTFLWETATLV